jgi:flagellar biosynthesis GTPase FlhF
MTSSRPLTGNNAQLRQPSTNGVSSIPIRQRTVKTEEGVAIAVMGATGSGKTTVSQKLSFEFDINKK